MEKARRDHLRAVIGEARRNVEDSLTRQLVAYGLFTNAVPLPREQLPLRPDQEAHYLRVLDVVRREGRATGSEGTVTPSAVLRYVRESGATWINRLAALRALETRSLLQPAAAFLSEEYGDLSPRASQLRDESPELSPEEALRRGIEGACRDLSSSVKVLFDLEDDQSLFWPDHKILKGLLRAFSTSVTEADWREADVLGWVYQYYNTEANAELKRRKNRTTGFKYAADDIPIANQFYTPHWVVRVLADNTLGRLWLEMHERDPSMTADDERVDGTHARWNLRERRQSVPNAATESEAFKTWLAEEPDVLRDKTVDRLCRYLVPLPSRPPPRGHKRVRDIRVLDPACGSGHFLLYAFDLLFAMYREEEPALDPREIPALILEHNLHGLDIDLRAAQLAAFNLYLKARTVLAAIDPTAILQLRRMNLVVADSHLGDDPRKTAFLERYRGEVEVQKLYAEVLASVDHTNVLGGLLKVRSRFEKLFERIATPAVTVKAAHAALARSQGQLFPTSGQLELAEVYKSLSGKEWTLDSLLADLERFEQETLPTQDIGARLFYSDLGRTLGLLGLLARRYDVVLMNPPYGDMPPEAQDYCKGNTKKKLEAHYPTTHYDYATAFLDQAIDLLHQNGMVGMLVSRSFMHLTSFEDVRTKLLLHESRPELVLDLGRGILDRADVRVCAAVVRVNRADNSRSSVVFNRLAYYRDAKRPERFLETLPVFAGQGADTDAEWYVARLNSLRDVPGMPYAYWASDSLRSLFRLHPVLDIDKVISPSGLQKTKRGDVKQGMATQDDARFTRCWWETSRSAIGSEWLWYAKGGSNICYYSRLDLLVLWRDEGAEIREWIREGLGDHPSRYLRNMDFQRREGVTWRAVAWSTRRFGYLPSGCMFSNRGSVVFLSDVPATNLACFLNSSLAIILITMQTPEREWHLSEVAALPIASGLEAVGMNGAARILELHRENHVGDETCRDFLQPDLRRVGMALPHLDLVEMLDAWVAARQERNRSIEMLLKQIDAEALGLYGVGAQDRLLIERELARRPKAEGGYAEGENGAVDSEAVEPDSDDEVESEAEDDATANLTPERSRDLVARWISYYLKQTIEADDDGIVPLGATHMDAGLIVRLRRTMAADLGEASAMTLEAQAPAFLGTEDLATWLAVSAEDVVETASKKRRLPRGFFPWHVSLYRNLPIFWLVSSENFERGRTCFTFRAYLHALKVSPDMLPRLVEYYLVPELARWQAELASARKRAETSDKVTKRRAESDAQELDNTVESLRRFKEALEAVIKGPAKAETVAASAKWLPRTIAAVRGGQDLGHGWCPAVDHGVKVNLTPLAEAKLLPRVVLKKLGG